MTQGPQPSASAVKAPVFFHVLFYLNALCFTSHLIQKKVQVVDVT